MFKIKNQNGFSLIELLVVVVITGIVIGVSIGIFHTQAQTFVTIFNRSTLMFDGRKAMSLVKDDARSIVPADISTMIGTKLVFDDSDGNTINYRYRENDKTLLRNGTVIAEYLQSAPFSYLDIAKIKTTDPSLLCYIQVNLNLKRDNQSIAVEELLYVRN